MITRTLQEVNALSQEFDEKLKKLKGRKIQRLFTMFGLLNNALYLAGVQARVISNKKSDGLRTYNAKNIAKLAAPMTIAPRMTGITTYLLKHWAGRCYDSKKTVEKVRKELSDKFKLYNLDCRDWTGPKGRNRKSNCMSNLDVAAALILAERIELILLEHYSLEEIQLDWSQEIGNGNYPTVRDESKSMPEHKAYTLVALYNMMFDGIVRWGRQDEPTDVTPLPEVVESIHNNFKELQAEQAFDRLQDEQPDRPPEEILATESFDFVAPEIIVSNGLSILVDRLIARIPLVSVIRRSMQVPPVPRVEVKKEASVAVPVWAMEKNDMAIAWWDEQLSKTGLWLSEMAPSWVLDAILPF